MATTQFLRIFNFGLGFLAADISAAATTITLQEGDLDAFPAPGPTSPYRIVIDREIMEVTGRDEALNNLAVIRGLEGTTATTHLSLALVTLRLTEGGLLRMQDAINALEAGLGTIQIRIDGGLDTGDRPRIQFVAGAGITITAVDSEVNNEVVVTITNDNP